MSAGSCSFLCFSSFMHSQLVPRGHRVASPHVKSREKVHARNEHQTVQNYFWINCFFSFCLFVFFLSFFLSCLSSSQLERSPRFGSERGETLEGMVICRTAFRFSTPYHQRDCVNKDKTQNKRGEKKKCGKPGAPLFLFQVTCLMKLMRRVALLLY